MVDTNSIVRLNQVDSLAGSSLNGFTAHRQIGVIIILVNSKKSGANHITPSTEVRRLNLTVGA